MSESLQPLARDNAGCAGPAIAGALVPIAFNAIIKIVHLSILQVTLSICLAFGALGWVLGRRIGESEARRWGRAAIALYGGVAIGILFWAFAVEELYFRRVGSSLYEEHSLFPIEIMMWCIGGTFPLALGVLTAFLANRIASRSSNLRASARRLSSSD